MGDVYEVPTEVRKERIENLSKRFSMEDALGDRIQSYSHGMRQKILYSGDLETLRKEHSESKSLENIFLELTQNE